MDGLEYIWTLLLICCYFNRIYSQMTMQENDYMIKGIRKGCQKEFPVDDTLVDELGSNRFPEDKNLMCFVNCVLQNIRVFNRGKLNIQLATKMIKIYGPIELQDEWLRGYEACQHIKRDENGDQCEWAYDMAKCFDKNNNNFARIWKRSD